MVDSEVLETVVELARAALGKAGRRPVVIGLCGAQGSGKTTLAAAVAEALTGAGVATAVLSLDDLYLTRAERARLAADVHPLLRTRGVPGTHDVSLGFATIAALSRGEPVPLPRFDKARDDRAPPPRWRPAPTNCAVLLFEGWCVGARPQPPEDLVAPVNALERNEDPDGTWRRYVNDALSGAYQDVFARLGSIVMLAAPSFEVIFDWRLEQEEALRRVAGERAKAGIMDAAGVARFIQHYERLTRYMLKEMPARADCVIELDARRRPGAIRRALPG